MSNLEYIWIKLKYFFSKYWYFLVIALTVYVLFGTTIKSCNSGKIDDVKLNTTQVDSLLLIIKQKDDQISDLRANTARLKHDLARTEVLFDEAITDHYSTLKSYKQQLDEITKKTNATNPDELYNKLNRVYPKR